MTRYIQPADIERITREVNIADFIADYVSLTHSGSSYKGLCPFHPDKTPSFVVSPEKGVFHCFGCGAGGNIFTFVMQWDSVDFPTAVRTVAEKMGISLSSGDGAVGYKDQLYLLNQQISSFYRQELERSPRAKHYLQQRSVDAETIRSFHLGWAPESHRFLRFCAQSQLSRECLRKLGLVRDNTRGSSYAYFRSRLVFPVLTWSGKVAGFGARVLDDGVPKYLNSPQSPIFNKGQMLYAIDLAREHIRAAGQAILVEGYIDAIALHQAGVGNVVASLGTALTKAQVSLLKRYTDAVTLAFDTDAAGQAATLRGIDLLLEQGLSVQILTLPSGKDPADMIQQGEKDLFLHQVEAAMPYIDYRIDRAVRQYGSRTTDDKLQAMSALLPTLSRISALPALDEAFRKISEAIKIREESLRIEFDKYRQNPRGFAFSSTSRYTAPREQEIEKTLLQLMLEDQEVLAVVQEHFAIENFTDARCRKIAQQLFLRPDAEYSPGVLISSLEDTTLHAFVSTLTCGEPVSRGCEPVQFAKDVIATLKKRSLQRRMKEIRSEALASEEQGAEDATKEYLRQVTHMKIAFLRGEQGAENEKR